MASLAPEVLRWEPMAALTPGLTGLEAYELIAQGISPFLAPKGRVLLEIGPDQADAVTAIFTRAGLLLEAVYKDMDGRDRVVGLQHSG
jgi:release factor glutamine methyltransferase